MRTRAKALWTSDDTVCLMPHSPPPPNPGEPAVRLPGLRSKSDVVSAGMGQIDFSQQVRKSREEGSVPWACVRGEVTL